jgi:hypothetical protein
VRFVMKGGVVARDELSAGRPGQVARTP